jgi:hypothetical protein
VTACRPTTRCGHVHGVDGVFRQRTAEVVECLMVAAAENSRVDHTAAVVGGMHDVIVGDETTVSEVSVCLGSTLAPCP